MVKWADYLVSKVKMDSSDKRIAAFMVHIDEDDSVLEGIERNRDWIIDKLSKDKKFRHIHLGENGRWSKGDSITLNNNGTISWTATKLPLIKTKRKCFISYYHNDDQEYKEKFKNLTSDLIINKSVEDGDIDSDVSDEYIKQLIQKGFLKDTTVLIVLIGPKTKCRKHIDWEISGALNLKVGDNYAGVLGLKLPTHQDYGTGKYTYTEQPARLTDNLKTGYAVIRDYTTDRKKLQEYIELAFANRKSKADERVNSRAQMKKNLCK